jgi:hypothetical protein
VELGVPWGVGAISFTVVHHQQKQQKQQKRPGFAAEMPGF